MAKDNFLEDVFGNSGINNSSKDPISDIENIRNFNRMDINSILNMESRYRVSYFEILSNSIHSIKRQIIFEVSNGQTGLDPERLELRNAFYRLKQINIAIVGHPVGNVIRRNIEYLIEDISDIEDELRTKPRGRIE